MGDMRSSALIALAVRIGAYGGAVSVRSLMERQEDSARSSVRKTQAAPLAPLAAISGMAGRAPGADTWVSVKQVNASGEVVSGRG